MSIMSFGSALFGNMINKKITDVFQKHIEDFGEVKELEIDFKVNVINCILLLKGEKETIQIQISNFSITGDDSKYFLTFSSIYISKEWLNLLVQQYLPKALPDKRVELPKTIGMILKIIL